MDHSSTGGAGGSSSSPNTSRAQQSMEEFMRVIEHTGISSIPTEPAELFAAYDKVQREIRSEPDEVNITKFSRLDTLAVPLQPVATKKRKTEAGSIPTAPIPDKPSSFATPLKRSNTTAAASSATPFKRLDTKGPKYFKAQLDRAAASNGAAASNKPKPNDGRVQSAPAAVMYCDRTIEQKEAKQEALYVHMNIRNRLDRAQEDMKKIKASVAMECHDILETTSVMASIQEADELEQYFQQNVHILFHSMEMSVLLTEQLVLNAQKYSRAFSNRATSQMSLIALP
jgi:hypothetical protein